MVLGQLRTFDDDSDSLIYDVLSILRHDCRYAMVGRQSKPCPKILERHGVLRNLHSLPFPFAVSGGFIA